MLKFLSLAFVGSGLALGVMGQVKKQFSVEDMENCDKVQLILKAKTGNCFIRPSQNSNLLNIYSNQEPENYAHTFSKEVVGSVCQLKLTLEQENQKGVGKKISYQVFGGNEKPTDKFWKVYLTETKPYNLNLDYGLGNANIDLSGLAISTLKVNTGSADVNISYSSGMENQVVMDTFFVKVDLGSFHARQLDLSRARVVVAEVGFGNITLDFGSKPSVQQVTGSVGAGNLMIILPSPDIPVIARVSDSWLCSLSLTRGLKKINETTFVNEAYSKNPKGALKFDLDVSMGNIIFKEKSN